MMEGVPDDLVSHDLHTFPREDPVTAAQRAKAAKEAEQAAQKQARLEREAIKKATAMPAKKQQAPLKDAKTQAQKAIMEHKVRLYFKKLGHKISFKEPKTLPKNEEELQELLNAIETELSSTGGIEMAGAGFVNACRAVEVLNTQYNPLGLHLSGPAASLSNTIAANHDKWDELVTEFAIAHAEWFMVGPGKRLLGFVMQTITSVDQANKVAILRASVAPPSEELQKEADDL